MDDWDDPEELDWKWIDVDFLDVDGQNILLRTER